MRATGRIRAVAAHVRAAGEPDFPSGAALVFGGTGGLGEEIVLALAEAGSNVHFTCNTQAAFAQDLSDRVRQEWPGCRASWSQCSNADITSVQIAVDEACKAHGSIHTLIYASGPHVNYLRPLKIAPAEFSRQMDLDVNGFYNMLYCTVPKLFESKGSVVAVTTCATQQVNPAGLLSAVPKAAIHMLVKHFASEYASRGLRANCAGVGPIGSRGMGSRLLEKMPTKEVERLIQRQPMKRLGSGREVADLVVFLASKRASYINGQVVNIDGGLMV